MSEPLQPPEGYAFFVGPYDSPLFQDPAMWTITDPNGTDAARVMTIHEVCGCPVIWTLIAEHNAWHASLGG